MTFEHIRWALREAKAFKPPFRQRVDRDDASTTLRHFTQRGEHARMVGAWVVADANHQVTVFEIVEFNGAFTQANSGRQARTGRPVAHVGTIREVAAAVFAGKQLVEERRFVGGTPGGIKLYLFRGSQAAQLLADFRESHLPLHRLPGIGCRVVLHWVGQAANVFQRIVAVMPQFSHRMLAEKFRGGFLAGRLPGNGLHAVFAKLHR